MCSNKLKCFKSATVQKKNFIIGYNPVIAFTKDFTGFLRYLKSATII